MVEQGEGDVVSAVRLAATCVEKPEMQQATEQRVAVLARLALLQPIRVGEHREASSIVDDVEFIETTLCSAKREPGEKLLLGGVAWAASAILGAQG